MLLKLLLKIAAEAAEAMGELIELIELRIDRTKKLAKLLKPKSVSEAKQRHFEEVYTLPEQRQENIHYLRLL